MTFDVVICGSGSSGIGAGRRLARQGLKVCILEARDRVGGRAWTIPVENGDKVVKCDLGCQWIHHSCKKNPLATYVRDRRNGIRSGALNEQERSNVLAGRVVPRKNRVEMYFDTFANESAGEPLRVDDDLSDEAEDTFERLFERVEGTIHKDEKDISLLEGLSRAAPEFFSSEARGDQFARMVQTEGDNIEHYEGADFDELSLRFWDDGGEYNGPNITLPDGYGGLLEHLAHDLKDSIHLSHPVKAIEFDADTKLVSVTCENGASFTAKHVVVTFPIGVLKAKTVTFKPPLPEPKQLAIDKIGAACMNKVILVFDEPFWPANAHSIDFVHPQFSKRLEHPIHWPYFVNTESTSGGAVLVGFTSGQRARIVEQETDEQIIGNIMANFRKAFHPKPVPDPCKYFVTRWTSDPYARGCWSYFPPTTTVRDFQELAQPICGGRIHFAGEATFLDAVGTCHGAFLSGEQAAKAIIKTEIT